MTQSTELTAVRAAIDQQQDAFQGDLFELLKIPSISAVGEFAGQVRQAAQWLDGHLRQIGLESELIETDGYPLVLAQSPPVPGRPVVLVYGHYDVQPPEPLEAWRWPPFEPTVHQGNVYARGASDDKGQMLTHLKSLQAWLSVHERLPVQVKLLIEGEEEIGSRSLLPFLAGPQAQRLACDVLVISDSSQFGPGLPAITYGLRGIAYFELTVRGPNQDLHSGTFGGAVTNPANVLCRMLSALVDQQGRIQVPGFYDDVEPLAQHECHALRQLPFDEQCFRQQLGIDGETGEAGYSILERRWIRPSFDVHGLTSGYQKEGAKTVLPAQASAKFSFRLVPRQDPQRVADGLRQLLAEVCPPGIRWQLDDLHGSPAVLTTLDSPFMHAAAVAIEAAFGRRVVYIREGGSIPVVSEFCQRLGVAPLLLGWGRDDDNMHAPNEKFSLKDYHRGIHASACLWAELGQLDPPTR